MRSSVFSLDLFVSKWLPRLSSQMIANIVPYFAKLDPKRKKSNDYKIDKYNKDALLALKLHTLTIILEYMTPILPVNFQLGLY